MIIKRVRRKGEFRFLIIDIIMVILLVANLSWIVFDWLYGTNAVQDLLHRTVPGFEQWYGSTIHPNFVLIDLVFVGIFLLDFLVGWIAAVTRGIYHRWFFYPFIHWYDLLGCIPVAGFRFLRLLRIITIIYRLHRSGIIDISDTGLGRTAAKYYAVLVEELSDRVVVKMLTDIQNELKNGSPVVDKIVTEVIRPRKPELVEWLSHRVETVASHNYERYREDLEKYLTQRVDAALAENDEFARLRRIPLAGPAIQQSAAKAVSDTVANITRGILQDLASERNRKLIDEVADMAFDALLTRERDSHLNRMVVDTLHRSLEIMKNQVSIQEWKLKEKARDEGHLRELLREELTNLARKHAESG